MFYKMTSVTITHQVDIFRDQLKKHQRIVLLEDSSTLSRVSVEKQKSDNTYVIK